MAVDIEGDQFASDGDNGATFGIVREELRHWPYTIHQIHDTLDLSLIEGRAKQILFQSLNTGNLTAFIGSGVSAAYGRMSWSDWQDAQLKTTDSLTDSLLSVIEASLERTDCLLSLLQIKESDNSRKINNEERAAIRWLLHRRQRIKFTQQEIKKLQSSFNLAKNKTGEFPGGDGLPIKFEIAQKLHDLVWLNRELFLAEKRDGKSDRYNEEVDATKFWGIRPDKSAGAPVEALQGVHATLETAFRENDEKAYGKIDRKEWQRTQEQMSTCMHEYRKIAERPEGKMSFEDLSKALLVDECAHAEGLLTSGLASDDNSGRSVQFTKEELEHLREKLKTLEKENFKRDIDGIRQNPDRFSVLQSFRIQRLVDNLKTPERFLDTSDDREVIWNDLFAALIRRFESYFERTDNDRTFLTPTSRFLVKLLLLLSPTPGETFKALTETKDLKSSDFVSRRSIISSRFDPLDRTIRELGIHRYLTTNYDFEIERLYQDIGFRHLESSSATSSSTSTADGRKHYDRQNFRVDALGANLWDSAFDPDNPSDLITFASANDGAEAAIFHLHGRATLEDPLVITERNYMDMYVRNTERREMIDEGITMAFSATPILFLGLGMQEADVLRPLRQFISDNDRSRGYTAMVLLPADNSVEARSKFASALYLRYGTHTIFYGSGEIELDSDGSKKERIALDWLYRIMQLMSELWTITDDELKDVTKQVGSLKPVDRSEQTLSDIKFETDSTQEKFKKLFKAVGEFGADLEWGDVKADDKVLPVLFGKSPATTIDEMISVGGKSFSLKLKSPVFTPQRPGKMSEARSERLKIDRSDTDGDSFLGFYLEVMTHIFRLTLAQPQKNMNVHSYLRELHARKAALDGLRGALLTATMCASLTGIEKEWRTWWKHWQQPPPRRKPAMELIGNTPDVGWVNTLPRRYIRYRVINSISDMSTAESTECEKFDLAVGRVQHKTHIRSFDTFIEAVAQTTVESLSKEKPIDSGRRFYTIAAENGLGKGTFFSVFATRLGLSSFLQAAHPGWDKTSDRKTRVVVMGGLYLNFAFATEIASVYDMCLNTIIELVCWLYGLETILIECNEKLSDERLDDIIDCSKSTPGSKRVYIEPLCFAAKKDIVSVLSQADTWNEQIPDLLATGAVKTSNNSEIHTLIEAIEVRAKIAEERVRTQYREVGRSTFLEHITLTFGKLGEVMARTSEVYCQLGENRGSQPKGKVLKPRLFLCLNGCELFFDAELKPKNMEISDFLRFLWSEKMSKVPFDVVAIGSESRFGGPWSYQRDPQSSEINGDAGPFGETNKFGSDSTHIDNSRVLNQHAGGMTSQAIKRRRIPDRALHHIRQRAKVSSIYFGQHVLREYLGSEHRPPSQTNFVYFARIMKPTRLLVDNFLPLATLLYLYHHSKRNPQRFNERTPDQFRNVYRSCQERELEVWANLPITEVESGIRKIRVEFLQKIVETTHQLDPDVPHTLDDLKIRLLERYSVADSLDVEEWRRTRHALASNRYCLTMLLAAAQEIALLDDDWIQGAAKATEFVRNTVNSILNVSTSLIEEVVLQSCLDVYRRFHVIGNANYDVELHHHLLRNIGVINSPVNTNVIVRLPAVRNYLNTIGDLDSRNLGRRRLVAKALFSLGDKGLVFRLSPHVVVDKKQGGDVISEGAKPHPVQQPRSLGQMSDIEWPGHVEFRYSLHRLVQQYCVSRLGSTALEPVRVNSFAPSLYASMPSGVPRLSHEAYLSLRALMVGLSQYPDIPHNNVADPVWLYSAQDRTTNVQSLRAAMTMVRSTFSIAVVSRFEEYKSIPAESGKRSRGYFETYKVRLRWIIRKAWELHVPLRDAEGKPLEYNTASALTHEPTDKINALYRDEIVWLYNEVGITCLVQGNLPDAIAHLRQASALNEEIEGLGGGRQHSLISLNLAITQMERGRLSKAESRLNVICKREKSTKSRMYYLAQGYLGVVMHITGKRDKATQLLSKAADHFERKGEDRATAIFRNHLGRLLGEKSLKKALEQLKIAREHAEAGGHEDIRHHILISTVKTSQLVQPNPHERLNRDRLLVQEVEEYARVMGIASLTCDALHTKALMLVENGDSTSSGQILVRAMAIAKRNDLQLRLNLMMSAYARILIRRGNIRSANRLLISCLESAKLYNYSLQIDRIHRVLEDEDSRLDLER